MRSRVATRSSRARTFEGEFRRGVDAAACVAEASEASRRRRRRDISAFASARSSSARRSAFALRRRKRASADACASTTARADGSVSDAAADDASARALAGAASFSSAPATRAESSARLTSASRDAAGVRASSVSRRDDDFASPAPRATTSDRGSFASTAANGDRPEKRSSRGASGGFDSGSAPAARPREGVPDRASDRGGVAPRAPRDASRSIASIPRPSRRARKWRRGVPVRVVARKRRGRFGILVPPETPPRRGFEARSHGRNEAAWVFDPILAHTVAREEVQHDVERGEGVPAGAPDRRRGGVVSVRRRPRRFRRRARVPLERFSGTSSSLASTPSSPLTFVPTASSSSPFPLLPRLASASKATTARSPSASAAPSAG